MPVPDLSDIDDLDSEDDDDFEMTPLISKHAELHESDGEGYYDKEDPENLDRFIKNNTKHYSNNERLTDPEVRTHLERRSPRLTPKKTDDETLRKSSKIKNAAVKVLVKKTTPSKAAEAKAEAKAATIKRNMEKLFETAAERKLQWAAKTRAEADARETKEKEEKIRLETERRRNIRLTKEKTGSTSAERKDLMLSPAEQRALQRQASQAHQGQSSRTAEVYDVALHGVEVPWNEKQGGKYRKKNELENSRRKDHSESFLEIARKKQETLANLQAALVAGATDPILGADRLCPEQLWADSFVTMLKRIPDEIRDEFMLYCQASALKAIRGQWPPQD